MNLTCPVCNAVFPAEAALMDSQAREAVSAALHLPAPLGDRLVRYLGLFRPAKRALSWDRVARLLNELLDPIRAGRLTRHGRTWAAPLVTWEAALDQMLASRQTLTLPLKTHGYLFEIVAGLAGKSEGAEESREIDRARNPAHRRVGQQDAVSADPAVTAAALGVLKHLTGGRRENH